MIMIIREQKNPSLSAEMIFNKVDLSSFIYGKIALRASDVFLIHHKTLPNKVDKTIMVLPTV